MNLEQAYHKANNKYTSFRLQRVSVSITRLCVDSQFGMVLLCSMCAYSYGSTMEILTFPLMEINQDKELCQPPSD